MLGPPSRLSPRLLGSGLCPDHPQVLSPQRSLPSTLPVLLTPPLKKAVPVDLSSSAVTTEGLFSYPEPATPPGALRPSLGLGSGRTRDQAQAASQGALSLEEDSVTCAGGSD